MPMIGQTTGAWHVMNYSVDGSVFIVINQRFIPCNNALRKFSHWSACRVKCMRVPYHEFCHRVRFFGNKSTHIFLCSSWPWTVLFAPLSGMPCSLGFMYYVLSDIHICTTLSPVADVPGRLDRWCQHLPRCYQTHTCAHNIIRGTHTSPTTGHELPAVRHQSQD